MKTKTTSKAPIKNTKQRELILSELRKLMTHPTAEELHDIVVKKNSRIGLCTVYRNLETFYKQGLVGKINTKPVRYDGDMSNHSHIRCTLCGKIGDILFNVPINPVEIQKLGYKLQGYKIEITGLCSSCIKKQKREE